MFPTLFTTFLRIFLPIKPAILSTYISGPEKQLLSELAAAAQQVMVATRSQDHTSRSPNSQERYVLGAENTTFEEPLKITRKRACEQDASTDAGQAKAKRRRPSADSDPQTPPIHGQGRFAEDVVRVSTSGYDQSCIPTLPPTNDSKLPNDGIEVRIPTTIHLPKGAPGKPQIPEQSANTDPTAQDSWERRKGRVKTESQADIEASRDLSDFTNPQGTEMPNRTPKATHKRFGDEESLTANLPTPQEPARIEAKRDLYSKETNGAESDDEGPETITASTGLNQARHAVEEADKARNRFLVPVLGFLIIHRTND